MIVEPGFGFTYDNDNNILEPKNNISNYGLFSTITILSSVISKVHETYGVLPRIGNTSKLLCMFKDSPDSDVFSKVFRINQSVIIQNPTSFGPDMHHTKYTQRTINMIGPYMGKVVSISEDVKKNIQKLRDKYDLFDRNRISVIYRGSDKWSDGDDGFIGLGPSAYVRMTTMISKKYDINKILIQSEEAPICKHFKRKFKAICIEETQIGPTTLTDRPIPQADKEEWLKNFISSLCIHAESDHLITYTGNSGLYPVILRNSINGVYQEKVFSQPITELFQFNDNETK